MRCPGSAGRARAAGRATALVVVAALVALPHGAPTATGAPRVADDVPVTPVDLSQVQANNSPTLAVDPTEPRFVALASRLDLPLFGCRLHLSGDAGRSWVAVDPVPTLPGGAERCYAPEVAFDRAGTLYFLFVGLAGPGNTPMGVYLTTSTDRGTSFARPRRLLGRDKFAVRMAIDPTLGPHGRIHLVWIDTGSPPSVGGFAPVPNPIVAAHSDDRGRSFSAPVPVSDPDRARVVAPALAVGPDHRVHVAYYDLGDDAVDYQGLEGPTWEGTWSLVVARSRDGGRRFSTGVVVDDAVVPPERVMLVFTMAPPALAAGPAGRLYVGWHDARNGDWDVFVRRSYDGGRRWEAPVRLNDDAMANRRHQYLPRLAVAPGGRVDAVFYDRRDDPENLANHVNYTYSVDAGASFAANLRLSELPSSSRTGPRYPIPSAAGLIEFGSRLALVSRDDDAVAAWTDTRNSRPGQQQDIFAASVVLRERRSVAGEGAARVSRDPESAAGRGSGRGGGGRAALALAGGLALLLLAMAAAFRWRREGRGSSTQPDPSQGSPAPAPMPATDPSRPEGRS